MSRNWTPQQSCAITAEGGVILVSAAAGSGKTAVLVERVIARLTDRERLTGADEILVATFTNAAAGEMRERISSRLDDLLADTPSDSYLRQQKMLLDTAAIGTVHSFCLQLIRENLGELQLAPDFRIGDEKELAILREDVARELLEERYSQGEENFFHMVELFAQGRDDSKVFATLFNLYGFIRSHPYYTGWLEDKLTFYSAALPVEETQWGKILLAYGRETVRYCQFLMRKALEIIQQDDLLEKYEEHFRSVAVMLDDLAEKMSVSSWDQIRCALCNIQFDRLPTVKGMADHEGKKLIADYRKQVKETLEELASTCFCCSQQEFAKDMEVLYPIVQELFSLTIDFDQAYAAAKRERRLIDFSDIEQFAIALLTRKTDEGYEKTPLAQALSQKYKYVLVDEYQDTNEAQDLIFSSLSNGKNLFMVGDVKQSIYRFRQAMPEIFLQKKESFAPYDNIHFPAKIILGHNFRSRGEVTGMVNFLFHMLMSEDVGELWYNEEEELISKADYPSREGSLVQLHLLTDGEEGELSAQEGEAAYAAGLIRQMLERGVPVTERGILRPCRSGDFAILLRSVKNKGDIYRHALEKEGIAAQSSDRGGYFASREISVMLSLLRTVDNPLLDIPLAAVLLSPIFAFSADELAEIRLADKKSPLIVGCRKLADGGNEKCGNFLSVLDEMRLLASLYPADQLIRRLIEMTGFGAIVTAMDNASVRTANLRLLSQYAHTYDKSGYKGLGGFLRFVDRLIEQGKELDSAAADGGEDKVRIMSIHASKGLEFPVVFLCDTSKKFNRQDLQGNTFLHPELGFAAMVRDFESRKQHTTIPVEAVKLELERSLLSEEMRMLYVAVTRAKEQLIITSHQSKLENKLSALNCQLEEDGRMPAWAVRRGGSYADWILMACLHHPDFGEAAQKWGAEPEGLAVTAHRLEIVTATLPNQGKDKGKKEIIFTVQPDAELVKDLEATALWQYPYQQAAGLPSKVSVTELVKGTEGLDYAFGDTPDFITGQKLSAADKGTALHQYMLFADHEKGKENPDGEIARLVSGQYLTAAQGECIPRKMLQDFYKTPLFSRMMASPDLKREFRFMTDVTGADLGELMPELGNQAITIQGVADALFEEDGRLVIVDYKTDNVQTERQLTERYQDQLRLYGRILTKILEKPVGELLLYSFKLGKTIPVK